MSNQHTFGQDIIEFREQFMRDNPDIENMWVEFGVDLNAAASWRVSINCYYGDLEHVHRARSLENAAAECLRRARFAAEQKVSS